MNDVPRLVYTSSVDSVSPLKDCFNLEEVKWYYPKASELAMPEYAITKQKAEKLVIGSHGRSLAKALHGELTYPNDILHVDYFVNLVSFKGMIHMRKFKSRSRNLFSISISIYYSTQ